MKSPDKQKVHILIPLAGRGLRFLNEEFDQPKPLIDISGKPMIWWSMKSFNFLDRLSSYQFIFVVLKEHDEKYHLGDTLKKLFGSEIKVLKVKDVTGGQAETCLKARDYIDNSRKLFIYNCDTYSVSKIWDAIEQDNPDGIISCFKSDKPHFSFVKMDEKGFVSEVAEKKPISNFATSGMYYFRRGNDFVEAADYMIKNKILERGEYYVLPCYNKLLNAGKKIKMVLCEKIYMMGTPKELLSFRKNIQKLNLL